MLVLDVSSGWCVDVVALVAEEFLSTSASQLTYHGLCELSASLKEEQLCVLFRNNHFSTLYKHKVASRLTVCIYFSSSVFCRVAVWHCDICHMNHSIIWKLGRNVQLIWVWLLRVINSCCFLSFSVDISASIDTSFV